MKGHTIIELTDVKTGKKERYVDNNMLTGALSEIFKTRGFIANSGLTENNLLKSCLGGIVLFDGALTESASVIQPPTSVKMVGNAAMDVTSSDEVTEMGSFNSNESGWQADGSYVAVYDFNTSQANGDIACVCLTSDVGGYIGYGNGTSGAYKSTRKSMYEYTGSQSQAYTLSGYRFYLPNYTNSSVEVIPVSHLTPDAEDYCLKTKKLKIETRQIPIKNVAINGSTTEWIKLSEREVTLPDAFCANNSRPINVVEGDNKLYLFHDYNSYGYDITLDAGETMYIVEIDRSFNVRLISILNTTGNSILRPQFAVESGYVIIQARNSSQQVTSEWYRVDMSDSSSIDLPSPYISDITKCHYTGGGRIIYDNVILDVVNGETYYCNGQAPTDAYIAYDGASLMMLSRNTSYITAHMCSLYLASINNLETPVTKTADKTMKISYRLAF